ncbi:MAG: hypothetical protein WC661_02215 [Opitutaceae bacterium]|jgi:hypothetical protein
MHFRLLASIFALGLSLLAPSSRAQESHAPLPPGAKEVKLRNLSVCFVLSPTVPELYFLDAQGEYKPLQIDTVRFGTWNTIPEGATLAIFRKEETRETRKVDPVTRQVVVTPAKITYLPVQTWTLPPGTDAVRKLFYRGQDGAVREHAFAPGADVHGALQARVMNLLAQPVAFRFNDQKRILNPGAETVLTLGSTPDEVFSFQYGLDNIGGGVYLDPVKNLRFRRAGLRLTVIFGYVPITEGDGASERIIGYRPEALRFYDDVASIPKPPKPVIVYSKRTGS